MKTTNKEMARRLIPFPPYDVESCESWLGEMAEEGLFLEHWGLTTARFRRGIPMTMRYRLTAARLTGSILAGPPLAPDAQEQSLYEDAGWRFICRQDEFFIYACKNPVAPELHTDPAVQAISLKMAWKSALWSFLGFIAAFLLHIFLNYSDRLILFLVEFPVLILFWFVFAVWNLFSTARGLYCISALRSRLRRGLPPDHHKNWRRSAPLYQCANGLQLLVLPLLGVFLIALLLNTSRTVPPVLSEQDIQGLPFATLGDLAEGTVVREESSDHNTIERRHSLLAPTIIEYQENGRVVQNDEVMLDTFLQVDYYETRFRWLAQGLVGDLHSRWDNLADQPQTIPELPGIDAVWAYSDKSGVFRQLILVQGNRIVSARWLDSYNTQDFEEIVVRFAEVFAYSK